MASISPALKEPESALVEKVFTPQVLPAVVVQANGTIQYPVFPKQALALESEATEQFFGGAAGGGKSHLLRIAGIRWCLQIPGLQVFLFRRLYADLKANHMEGAAGFPALLGPWVEKRLCHIIQGEIQFYNGSKIYLRHCLNENSLLKYQGAEIHLLLFDELTHFTEAMYRYLRGRCRVIGVKIPAHFQHLFPRILSAANPGGVGHGWVKKTFVDPGEMIIHKASAQEGGRLRQFIPSRVVDNPALMLSDPTYLDRLEGLGDRNLVRAMKEGDWDVVAGAMFGDVWRRFNDQGVPWHVIPGFDIPAGWDLWRGADDGYAAPAACYWFTQDPDTKTIYVIDELYRAGMLPEAFAEEVKKRDRAIVCRAPTGELYENPTILRGMIDAAAFANTGQQDSKGERVLARGDAMNRLGCNWTPVDKGPGSRIQRVQDLHRLLAPNPMDVRGRPGIQFFARCTEAIRTIPTIPRDKKNIEDIDTDAEDHPFDGVTYGTKWKRSYARLVPLAGV